MVDPHEGVVSLRNTFKDMWEFLKGKGEIRLQTDKKGTPFTTKASMTKKGIHRGEQVIRFFRNRTEMARSYECCWGHYHNCNRTRIGMYCKALDASI